MKHGWSIAINFELSMHGDCWVVIHYWALHLVFKSQLGINYYAMQPLKHLSDTQASTYVWLDLCVDGWMYLCNCVWIRYIHMLVVCICINACEYLYSSFKEPLKTLCCFSHKDPATLDMHFRVMNMSETWTKFTLPYNIYNNWSIFISHLWLNSVLFITVTKILWAFCLTRQVNLNALHLQQTATTTVEANASETNNVQYRWPSCFRRSIKCF